MPPYIIPPEKLWAEIIRLANESDHAWRFTKKGDRRPREDVEAQKAARRKTIKAKQDAAAERLAAEQKARRAAKTHPDGSVADRMVKAMDPGKWYGQGDLMRLAEADRSARSKVHQVLKTKGWIEKAANPRYVPGVLNPWVIMGGAEPEPKHLYRLTPAGEARRTALLSP